MVGGRRGVLRRRALRRLVLAACAGIAGFAGPVLGEQPRSGGRADRRRSSRWATSPAGGSTSRGADAADGRLRRDDDEHARPGAGADSRRSRLCRRVGRSPGAGHGARPDLPRHDDRHAAAGAPSRSSTTAESSTGAAGNRRRSTPAAPGLSRPSTARLSILGAKAHDRLRGRRQSLRQHLVQQLLGRLRAHWRGADPSRSS